MDKLPIPQPSTADILTDLEKLEIPDISMDGNIITIEAILEEIPENELG